MLMKSERRGRDIDTWGQYLNWIGRHPLLTADQEINLSRQVQRMMELKALDRELTKEEQREMKIGKRAEDQMVTCNLRLVVSVARRYAQTTRFMEIDDLIQEASAQMLKAVRKFDPLMGYKFSTYAIWWIRQSLNRAIDNQDRTLRLPVHVKHKMGRMRRLVADYGQQHGASPSVQWLSDAMGMTADQIVELQQHGQLTRSLDEVLVEDGSPLIDTIPAPVHDQPKANDEMARLEELLHWVAPREREIVRRRYGIGCTRTTLASISREMGISRERTRQLANRAEMRLRLLAGGAEPMRHETVEAKEPKRPRSRVTKPGEDLERYRPILEPLAREGVSMRRMSAALAAAGKTTCNGTHVTFKTVDRILCRLGIERIKHTQTTQEAA